MDTEQSTPASNRPKLVTYAVYLIYLSAVLGVLSDPFAGARQFGLDQVAGEAEGLAGVITLLLCACAPQLVIALILVALGRSIMRRSNRGRLLYAAWTVLGLVLMLILAGGWLEQWTTMPVAAVLGNAAFLMRLTALILVFLPASNTWFRFRADSAHIEAIEQ